MRIRRLELRDFRRYRDLDIDLAPGLTVVRGPNEAGKSTIQRAIELAITRRVTSSAGDLDALRPWDAADGRALGHHRSTSSRTTRTARRPATLEKTFAGSRGHGPARLRRPVHHRPGPRRPGPRRADRASRPRPSSARPRPSATTSSPTSTATRAPCATGSRRRSAAADRGTSRAKREARTGAPRPDDQGRQEPGSPEGRRAEVVAGPGRPSNRASWPSPSWRAIATRSRAPSSGGPRPRRPWPSVAGMLEKARQAERLTAERAAAQDRYERFRQAVEVNDRGRASWPRPTRRPTRCRSSVPASNACGRSTRRRASCGPRSRARSTVTFEVAARADAGGRCRAGGRADRSSASLIAGGSVVVDVARRRRARADVPSSSAGSSPAIGLILAVVALWMRRSYRMGPSSATSRSTGASAAAPRWRPSSPVVEADLAQQPRGARA